MAAAASNMISSQGEVLSSKEGCLGLKEVSFYMFFIREKNLAKKPQACLSQGQLDLRIIFPKGGYANLSSLTPGLSLSPFIVILLPVPFCQNKSFYPLVHSHHACFNRNICYIITGLFSPKTH